MRTLLAVAAAIAVAAALAVPALAGTRTVAVGDYYFGRAGTTPTITVRRGTVVRWVFRGRVKHDLKARSGPQRFTSRARVRGSYRKRVTRRGTYRIVCTLHPGMEMTLKVR